MATANQKAKAGIIATRKLLKAERMAGFRATSSALDAIYGNLSTTQAGIGRSQTIANQKTMSALARLAGKTDRATGRIVRGGEAAARNAYGGVVAGAVDRASGVPEAHAAAASASLSGEVKAGRVGARGASDVLAITRAGAKEAAAGAAGQLADALQYRAKQDAQIVAGLQQARMEAQLQFQNWKKQQEYLSKQEEKDATGALGGVRQAADTAGDAAVWFRTYRVDNPESTAPEMLAAYHEKFGSLGGNEDPLLSLLARNVINTTDENGQTLEGVTWQEDARMTVQALHTLYPNFGKVNVFNVIHASMRAYGARAAADQLEKTMAGGEQLTPQEAEAEADAKGLTGRSKAAYITGHTVDLAPAPPTGLSVAGTPLMTTAEAEAEADRLGYTGRSKAAFVTAHSTPA